MTLTLIPAATQWVIAGSPASVPGILIIALGRSTAPQRRSASWMVARVSCASAGETSSDTCPSTPPVTWCSPANSSQAARTSATASASKISPALRPCSLSRRMSASYEALPAMAFSKIVGFEVMPRRPSSRISRRSSPVATRSRVM